MYPPEQAFSIVDADALAREAFDAAPIAAAVISATGRFLQVNRALTRLFGYGQVDLASRTVDDLIMPGDVGKDAAEAAALLAGGVDRYEVEQRFRRRDGDEIWCRVSVALGGADDAGRRRLFQFQDITPYKSFGARLRASEERFRSLVAHASDLITVLDRDGTILYESPSVLTVLGHDPVRLVGQRAFDLVHPADRDAAIDAFAEVIADPSQPRRAEFRFRHADGSWRWLEAVGSNLLSDPSVRGVVASSRDITPRKAAEAKLAEREQEARANLELAQRRARELDLLGRVRSAIARELALPGLFRTTVEAVAAAFGYSLVSLYLLDGDHLVLQHQVGYDRVIERVPQGAGVVWRVVRTGAPVLLADVCDDPAFLGAVDGIRAEVCVPLRDEGRVVGVLNLETTDPAGLGPEDLRLMEAVAEHVGVAIERARLFEAARLSGERFRAAFDSSAIGAALVDLDGRWLTVNRALSDMVGYTEQELRDRTFRDITHADDLEEDTRLFAQLLAGEIPVVRFQKRYLHRDGSPVWVQLTANLIRGMGGSPLSVLAQVQDIGEQRRVEDGLRASEQRYRALVEQLPGVVYELANDAAQTVRYFSPRGKEMIGLTFDDVQAHVAAGGRWHDFVHPDDRARVIAEDAAAEIVGDVFRAEYRHAHGRGGFLWVRDESTALRDDGGEIVSYQGIIFDITDQKRAEAELRAAKEAAEQASRAKSAFLSTMTHELRTPLTAIIGYAELMRSPIYDQPLTPQQDEDVSRIVDSAHHLMALISDILDQARLEAGALDLVIEPTDLVAVVESVRLLVAPSAAAKDVALVVELPPGLPPVAADSLRLRQILLNLAANAVKFTAAGSVRIEAQADGDWITVVVADTGVGIPPEALERVFEEFRQADATTSRTHGGAGLGLSITRRLVDLHGGSIAVASEPGVGSRFTVWLPAARTAAPGG
jgi:PAS domain S-box-containing protein